MTNSEQQPAGPDSENTPDTSAKKPRRGSQRRSGAGTNALGLLGIFLALLAIGMASYTLYELLVVPVEPAVDTSAQDSAVAELRQQLTTLQQQHTRQSRASDRQLKEIQRQLASESRELAEQQDVLADAMTSLRSEIQDLVGTSSQDWLFAEVEYLLRLANQRVLMERDPESARLLLRAADDIVRKAQGLAAYELRQAIALDLARLESTETVDVDGVYLRLSALAAQAMSLPRQPRQFVPSATDEADAKETDDASNSLPARAWNLLLDAGQRLASLVDYRRDGVAIAPILPPKEEYYLRQNLVLKLQMAQLAVLRADQVVYDQALREVTDWVERYFDGDAAATLAMQAAVSQLQAVRVETPLPDISGSLTQARSLMARFSEVDSRAPVESDETAEGTVIEDTVIEDTVIEDMTDESVPGGSR